MRRVRIRVGIIGCGAIGSEIAKACEGALEDRIELVAICDADTAKAKALNKILKKKTSVVKLDALIRDVDLVVEAASASASGTILEKCIKSNRDLMVMSVGGLLGKEKVLQAAEMKGVRVHIPSGAVAGLDGLKAASTGDIESVELVTRKPPKGLAGAPYLAEKAIDLDKITDETVLFDGTAEEAIRGFPQNINVSAVLSLAGIGPRKTRVRIITSPEYTMNIHEIEVRGAFGRITTRAENVPSRTNPKTSELAIRSAIATLGNIARSVKIGT